MDFRRTLVVVLSSVFALLPGSSQESAPAYKNPQLTVEERAVDLLKRMTLEAKGTFDLMVGPSSSETASIPLEVVN